MEIKKLYDLYLRHPDITTDSRNIKPGQLFFGLKGPTFDGNAFALKALEQGAAYAIVDEKFNKEDERILYSEDVLTTLQQLSKYHREKFSIPFIAITGSNGKTTTKELVAQVLSTKYKTTATVGNLNNHIGIPLTLLKVPLAAEMAIIEMGANHQHEIESYCKYALPTHGLITNCGKAHLEGFGGVEGVIKGKGELFKFIEANEGVAFVNNYDEAIKGLAAPIKKLFTYGPNGNIQGTFSTIDSFLNVSIKGEANLDIRTNLVGSYNLPNVLAAVAIGKYFNIDDDKIKSAIESYYPSNSRSQLIKKDSNEIILDAYNANPSSMKAAIENFALLPSGKKVLMLGSMMELGSESDKEHQEIVDLIDKHEWNRVVLVGSNFSNTKHKYVSLQNSDDARQWFHNNKIHNSTILIKGSRSMKMEKVLE